MTMLVPFNMTIMPYLTNTGANKHKEILSENLHNLLVYLPSQWRVKIALVRAFQVDLQEKSVYQACKHSEITPIQDYLRILIKNSIAFICVF